MRLIKGLDAIFVSLQGEGMLTGTPQTFVRMHGCNSRCTWCDQQESLRPRNYNNVPIDEIFQTVIELQCKDVCFTGGEPLMQTEELANLTCRLSETHSISVETNASIFYPLPYINFWSFSPKLHDWHDEEVILWIHHCTYHQVPFQVKVVCNTISEVTSAITRMGDYRESLMIQPRWATDNLDEIVEYCIEQNLRLSFQVHKFLGIK